MAEVIPDVYFDKTQSRQIKLELYKTEFGQCVDVQSALTYLIDSFLVPPALNLRWREEGWFNLNTGETLSSWEVKRRFLVWTLEQMKDDNT